MKATCFRPVVWLQLRHHERQRCDAERAVARRLRMARPGHDRPFAL